MVLFWKGIRPWCGHISPRCCHRLFFRCLVQPGMIVEEEMMVEGREPRCALHYPLLLLPHVYLKRKYNAIKHYGLDEWAIKRWNILCDITQFVITLWVRGVTRRQLTSNKLMQLAPLIYHRTLEDGRLQLIWHCFVNYLHQLIYCSGLVLLLKYYEIIQIYVTLLPCPYLTPTAHPRFVTLINGDVT